jgi:hypothetical protein
MGKGAILIDPYLCTLYPPEYAKALQQAAVEWTMETRVQRIDALTDQLVRLGFARPRSDDSMTYQDARGL